MNLNYLVIEGNIGAGKTTLTQLIGERFQAKLVLERFEDNPFLPKFYDNPQQYAFPLEMAFLAERYKQLNRELNQVSPLIISDYYLMKSLIFAQNTLPPDEYSLYRQFFSIISEKMPKPDLYVYLHKNTDLLLNNIVQRGRSYEANVSLEYLEKITQGYFSYFRQQIDFPILIIDANGIDFVNRTEDFDKIVAAIFKNQHHKGINRIIL